MIDSPDTRRGRIMNIPPSGKKVACRRVMLLTVDDQQIVDGRNIWDVAGFLRGIGLLPRL
jgi:predicted ester cyclase